MVEFFKVLIEEPEKQRKTAVFLIKASLNIIFSSKLYSYALHENIVPSNITFNTIFDYIITGRFVVFCLFYLFSYLFIFGFLDSISIGALQLFYKKIVKKMKFGRQEKDLINKVLVHFELIHIDEKGKKVTAAKNTDAFHEFIEVFTNKENQIEIVNIKNSLVKDIAHTFFVFVLIYFACINLKLDNNVINWLIFAGSIFIPFLYFVANGFIDFLNENAKDISFEIQRLRLEKSLTEILSDLGLLGFDIVDIDTLKMKEVISHKNKNYHIEFRYVKRPIYEFDLTSMKEKYIDKEKKVVLITNSNLDSKAKEISDDYSQSILIIKYNNEHDLKDKIAEYFKNK